MKKILSIVVIASFILSFMAFLPAMAEDNASDSETIGNNGVKANSSEDMEKIPSPDQIRYFKNIIKKGMTLFGIKKDKMVEKKESIASSTAEKMEKIPAPQFVGLYERIKQIGKSLWGYKKEKREEKRRLVTAGMSACVITAVETKDTALVADNTAFTTELNSAITARTACQKTALGSTENQFTNLDVCVKAFKDTTKASRHKYKKNHEAIWKTYRESLKTCVKNTASTTGTSTSAEKEDSQGELNIEDGGGSITEVVSE